ncbi:MAG: hypothetical protein R2761_14340 [Acidimicrobiales bacterium]
MPDHTERTDTSAKAEGDDEGKSFEINDETESEETDLQSRSGDDYQGKSFQINDNSKGADQ